MIDKLKKSSLIFFFAGVVSFLPLYVQFKDGVLGFFNSPLFYLPGAKVGLVLPLSFLAAFLSIIYISPKDVWLNRKKLLFPAWVLVVCLIGVFSGKGSEWVFSCFRYVYPFFLIINFQRLWNKPKIKSFFAGMKYSFFIIVFLFLLSLFFYEKTWPNPHQIPPLRVTSIFIWGIVYNIFNYVPIISIYISFFIFFNDIFYNKNLPKLKRSGLIALLLTSLSLIIFSTASRAPLFLFLIFLLVIFFYSIYLKRVVDGIIVLLIIGSLGFSLSQMNVKEYYVKRRVYRTTLNAKKILKRFYSGDSLKLLEAKNTEKNPLDKAVEEFSGKRYFMAKLAVIHLIENKSNIAGILFSPFIFFKNFSPVLKRKMGGPNRKFKYHNFFIDTYYSFGIIGLLLLLSFLWSGFKFFFVNFNKIFLQRRPARKDADILKLKLLFIICFIDLGVVSLFKTPFLSPYATFFTSLLFSIMISPFCINTLKKSFEAQTNH